MNCMKCGRDIEEGQIFCSICLDDMAKYPVKPNIAIQLPHREHHVAAKKPQARRRPATAEEKLQVAHRFLRRILVLWLITLGLLIASLYPAALFLLGETFRLPGQNYSTFSTEPTAAPTAAESVPTTTTP